LDPAWGISGNEKTWVSLDATPSEIMAANQEEFVVYTQLRQHRSRGRPAFRSRFALRMDRANRMTAMSADLAQYRILHFATHGWYSLDLPNKDFAVNSQIELEFVSDDGARRRMTLERSGQRGSQSAAWIHFNRPGSLTVRASCEELTPRALGYAELMRRSRDMTLAKAELTVFFLCELLPIVAWILTVCFLRALAYRAIRRIPRAIRVKATREVDAMFTVAKWAGVGCYLIWTAKDVLSGVGIVFVT
jgi:hypothetical protein